MTIPEYYEKWINLYKVGAVRDVTLQKYFLTLKWLKKLANNVEIENLDRIQYQEILNQYALSHEKQTVIDFNHHLKAAVLDAIDEGMIEKDPTRRVVLKGKAPKEKKPKFLNQFELQKLLADLNLEEKPNLDWLILLIAKTGMRCSEAIALTPKDFNFNKQIINVSKTWDYKNGGGFVPTKNKSSVRSIQIDWQIVGQFSNVIKNLSPDKPIFIEEERKFYNSTLNERLAKHCRNQEIPVISVHGLRHTHASILLASGASIASVSRRLGHSNMTTTQKVYLHIIQELEDKDTNIIMKAMAVL